MPQYYAVLLGSELYEFKNKYFNARKSHEGPSAVNLNLKHTYINSVSES